MSESERLLERQRAAVAWLRANRPRAAVRIAAAVAKLADLERQLAPARDPGARTMLRTIDKRGKTTLKAGVPDVPKSRNDQSKPIDPEYLVTSSIRPPHAVFHAVGTMRDGKVSRGAADPSAIEEMQAQHRRLRIIQRMKKTDPDQAAYLKHVLDTEN